MSYFEVRGGNKLEGEITIPGAKNAALPMLCAALLTTERCTFHNVPEISDIAVLLDVFAYMGVEVERSLSKKIVHVHAKEFDPAKLAHCEDLKKLRATILLLGPILARYGEAKIVQPGGDVIGKRSNFIHLDGLQVLGCELLQNDQFIHFRYDRKGLKQNRILLSEASVTGTENLAMFLAGQDGDTAEIFFAAAEPHVCATLRMLEQMGATIENIGAHHLKITGSQNLKGGEFTIPPDGILVGTYAIAGLITGGEILIKNVDHKELFSFYGALKRLGAQFEMEDDALHVLPSPNLQAIPKIQTAIFPGFSSDLQSLFGLLLTQCEGKSMIFETLYEGRFTYLNELEKMGAKVAFLNSHQAQVFGPTKLTGCEVQSWDLRAGATMVLAGLIAEGTTKITSINYIDRGYEHFDENLRSLGADIKRINF